MKYKRYAALLALTMLATGLLAPGASAQTLSADRAERLAARLVDRQLDDRERRLVEARVSVGERVNRRTIRFLYDDLNRQGIVCVAVIEVTRTGNSLRGRFGRSNCEQLSDEALAYRAAARTAAVQFIRRERSILRAVSRYIESAEGCETLDIPADRQDEARLLLNAGLTQATFRPLTSTLNTYASTLTSLAATDPQLAAGAAAWRDAVDTVRALPRFQPSYCAALAEWAADGFTDESAPLDFAALRETVTRLRASGAEIRRTSRYLARLGVDPVTATAFGLDNFVGELGLLSDDM